MQTSGRLLLYGLLHFFLNCGTSRGVRFLPSGAVNFTQCDPFWNECPANSACEETTKGFYCACGNNFFNVNERMTITYPGGECLERCSVKGNTSPCACRRGSVLRLNENGLYVCAEFCSVQGKSSPCACKPGFVAMLNENGFYVCIVNSQCPTGSRT